MKINFICLQIFFFLCCGNYGAEAQLKARKVENFNKNWKFLLADSTGKNTEYNKADFNDGSWRTLNLPHDWSIEGEFKKDNPATPEGGALPGGIGWYRKSFLVPMEAKGKNIAVEFDGIYQKSEVWINDHYLGIRPNGYISFSYDLTPYIKFGSKNQISVKVDNSKQPNSRWYSGSGIYRNVRLVYTAGVAVDHWGIFVSTPRVDQHMAIVHVETSIRNTEGSHKIDINTILLDRNGKEVLRKSQKGISIDDRVILSDNFELKQPILWSVNNPYRYKILTQVLQDGIIVDDYETLFGIRYFHFDIDKGFSLNGKSMKILGVCEHHDLGALGSAVNIRALERQLEILKGMGVNGIRTSHNPPTPELLDLCDKMGFVVMDEAFDVWRKGKKKFDYHLYFDEWHQRDLEDQVKRDRNHPSVIMWSIGNEIPEQTDTSAFRIAKELAAIIHRLDTSRPITAANNNPDTRNQIIQSGAVDLTGYNYHHNDYPKFQSRYPGKIFLGTETTSALETRGEYDMPSDSIRRWPDKNPGKMNADFTVSAYDNVSARWGSTHEETWKIVKKYDFLTGMFIWTGFDYLGEPTPYSWPARSSYFGIIDLAGFPKDVYYMYQSEWTDKTVLHLLPHWNWNKGDAVDVWAYFNHADEVELFLNGKSLGTRKKQGDELHVSWKVAFEPGVLKAISRKKGITILTAEVKTAGIPAKIELSADRNIIQAGGEDLSFVTVRVLDAQGNLVPKADNLIQFDLQGDATISGVDNGNPVSHEPFKANHRLAFNGLALAIVRSGDKEGKAVLTATCPGLQPASIEIDIK